MTTTTRGDLFHPLGAIEGVGRFVRLAGQTVWVAAFRLRLRVTIEQIYRQGVRALWLASVAAVFYGMVLALQLGLGLTRFGATALVPEVTTLGLFRELVPVLVGLVVGTRLSAGIAAELGAMAVTEQLDAVRVLGADPARELMAPRVVAAMLVLPLVTIYTDVLATFGAMIIADTEFRIAPRWYLAGAARFMSVADFGVGLIKAAVFGAVMAMLACWYGSRVTGGTAEVGQASTRAVVGGALSVILIDFLLSRITAGW